MMLSGSNSAACCCDKLGRLIIPDILQRKGDQFYLGDGTSFLLWIIAMGLVPNPSRWVGGGAHPHGGTENGKSEFNLAPRCFERAWGAGSYRPEHMGWRMGGMQEADRKPADPAQHSRSGRERPDHTSIQRRGNGDEGAAGRGPAKLDQAG